MATELSQERVNLNIATEGAAGAVTTASRIEHHARVRPDATAVVCGEQRLKYAELDRRANAVAQQLRSGGVGADDVVGLLTHRNASFVIAALGVLKAGAAYFLLDPAFPSNHLAEVFRDSGACALVAEDALQGISNFPARVVISIESAIAGSERESSCEASKATAENLAYVIYTSGSTGSPKGVEILHRGLENLIEWHQNAFGLTATDRVSQFASLSFDAAVWEIWPALTVGASLHFVPDSIRRNAKMLRDWFIDNGITIGFVPTPVAEALITLPWRAESALRVLLTGADTLHRFPPSDLPFQLVNNYGPTECTVVATSGTVPAGYGNHGLPSIGKPIANTTIHLLNDNLAAVAEAESGEIFIGGAGVARGYRNRPSLTAERFVIREDGERLYRTGDLGRLLPNGEIEFLGRADDQIKISGFRIEPAQIIRALESHPGVETAAVVAQQDDGKDSKKLVAYVVENSGFQLKAAELRDFLRLRLPTYMLPVMFVRIEDLPLTPNGKLDRASLPAPNSSNLIQDDPESRPSTVIEERLLGILSKLLGVERVAVDDNFFNLGGHSLMATQLIARIRESFGVELSLRGIFDAPTAAQLAEKIEHSILAKVTAMSEEEAQRMLSTMNHAGPESAPL